MNPATLVSTARTLRFVPGDRPERFAKAVASGADLVVADLEDAVAPGQKQQARANVAEWLDTAPVAAVRVNGAGTPWHKDDLAMVSGRACVVLLPKAEDVALVAAVTARLADGSALVALVETARGVLAVSDLAHGVEVARLAFGSFDLAAELGVSPDDREAMAPARGALVLASAAAGLPPPVDGVTGYVPDVGALRADVEHARRLGFTGKLCIHPRQVEPAAEALSPSHAEILWAQAVVQAAATTGGVAVIEGRMVDKPVLDRAARLLAGQRASRTAYGAGKGS